jgi:hypothetical protein
VTELARSYLTTSGNATSVTNHTNASYDLTTSHPRVGGFRTSSR